MSYSFILLLNRHVALVIFTSVTPAIEQKFCKIYVTVTMTIAFHVVYKPAETDKCLFHLLMTVVPFLFTGTDICHPAVSKLFGSIIQSFVFPFSKSIVINCRFNKISCHISFMISPGPGVPIFLSTVLYRAGYRLSADNRQVPGLQELRESIFQGCLHFFLGGNYFLISLRINHQMRYSLPRLSDEPMHLRKHILDVFHEVLREGLFLLQ